MINQGFLLRNAYLVRTPKILPHWYNFSYLIEIIYACIWQLRILIAIRRGCSILLLYIAIYTVLRTITFLI